MSNIFGSLLNKATSIFSNPNSSNVVKRFAATMASGVKDNFLNRLGKGASEIASKAGVPEDVSKGLIDQGKNMASGVISNLFK